MTLKLSATPYKQKNTNIFRYQTNNLLQFWFAFLVWKKVQKEAKSEFVTKSVGIIDTIIFM